MPRILVFAGPNGSGKSTVTSNVECIGQYINADNIKKMLDCSDLKAAQIAEATRFFMLENHMDFTFETVLSTKSKIDFLSKAKKEGYTITCIYVLTNNPSININRVKQRVKNGGHSVPEEKIVSRYIRALKLIPELLNICDEMYVFDNSSDNTDSCKRLVMEYKNGELSFSINNNWSIDSLKLLISGKYSERFE